MLIWHDIGIRKNDVPGGGREQELTKSILERIGAGNLTQKVLEGFAIFTEETSFTLRWSDVPLEKARLDYEQFARAMYYGFKGSFPMTLSDVDEEINYLGGIGELKHNLGFSFFHSLDVAVSFAEQEAYSRTETQEFIEQLLTDKSFYAPLYLREFLNSQQLSLRGGSLTPAIKAQLRPSTSFSPSITSIDDEAGIAAEFLAHRQKIVLPQRLVVHTVDGQVSEKSWRTYDQVKQRTAKTLASVATYGLVAGGVVGGILPTIIHGTIDRADLMIMNWYPQYQGVVLCPLDSFVQPSHPCAFPHSMSVMIDDEKSTGTDVFVGPAEKVLPYIEPPKLVVVASLTLNVRSEAERLAYLLKRPVDQTLDRCVFYNPFLWGNFHHFNEWLQTTPQGNELLERKFGRKFSEMKCVAEVKKDLNPADSIAEMYF